jgi:uncharacterized protein (TIGR03066 family)
MNKSTKSKKQPQKHVPAIPPAKGAGGNGLRMWCILAVALLITAGATLAIMEYVVWNKLPSELVGRWEVVHGPDEYKEAVFEFHRSGKLIGHLNHNGNLQMMKADVRVEADKLFITTRRQSTGEVHVSVQTITKLNERHLVVMDEVGRDMKLARIP